MYLKSCRRANHASWREFVEKTPDEKGMARLVKIAQRKEIRTINTLLKEDGTLTEPGAETIRRLTSVHFPATTEGSTDIKHNSTHKIATTNIQKAFEDWINEDLVRKAFKRFFPYKAAEPDGLKPILLQHLPPKVIEAITLIFQACIALKHTPKKWREPRHYSPKLLT